MRTTRLLAEPNDRSWLSRPAVTVARRVIMMLLARFSRERLTIVDCRGRSTFGSAGEVELDATVTVVDDRAYLALLTEGSAGLGRAYFEHWWTSDDPVAVLRVLIRNMEPWDRRRNRLTALVGPVGDWIRRRRPADTRDRNRDDISAHYDLGNDFFELFLDQTMTYSSAVFPDDDFSSPLAVASGHKYDRLLELIGPQVGDHLLEIGTGWGGFALHAASRGFRVTTTTISDAQLSIAKQRVGDAGVGDRVALLDVDWRDLTGSFDHLVSIEMIEAVNWRDYDDFFATIDRLVAPGGRAGLQMIVVPDSRWERTKNTVDFIRRYVFPNGYLPSVAAVRAATARSTSWKVTRVDDYTEHYAETLRRWRRSFDDNVDRIRALGYDERFIELWRFYLMYCEAGFTERHVELKQILLER